MPSVYSERYESFSVAQDALTMCWLKGGAPAQEFGEDVAIEAQNCVSTYLYETKRDTGGKDWWDAKAGHDAIYRALNVDKADEGAFYATMPFRLFNDGERYIILVAYPVPRVLGPVDMDHLDIEQVLAWDPVKDEAWLWRDDGPALFGPEPEMTGNEEHVLFANPRDMFVEWMMARAQAWMRFKQSKKRDWHQFIERDTCPGQLSVGDLDAINWSNLPKSFEARGFDIQKLNRAILRGANVPRAYNGQQRVV